MLVSVHRSLWVVVDVFDTFHDFSLVSLLRLGELFDGLLVGILGGRKSLCIAGLTSAVRAYLSRIASEFIKVSFVSGTRNL